MPTTVTLRPVRIKRKHNADLKALRGGQPVGRVVVVPRLRDRVRRSQPTEARQVTLPEASWELVDKIAAYEQRSKATVIRTLILLGMQVYERLADRLGTPSLEDAPISPCPSPLAYMTDEIVRAEVLDYIVDRKRSEDDAASG